MKSVAIAVGYLATLAAIGAGCGGGTEASASSAGIEPILTPSQASWSPDGSTYAVTAPHGIILTSVDGLPPREIKVAQPSDPIGWSRGHDQLTFLSGRGSTPSGKTWASVIRRDGQSLRQQPLGVPVSDAAWAPAGFPLAFVPNSNVIDLNKGRLGPNPDVWVLLRLGGKPRPVSKLPGVERDLVFSPDGRRLLFVGESGKLNSVWSVRTDGTQRRKLFKGLIDVHAAWSPDGARLALTAVTETEDSRYHLYVGSATGGKLREVSKEEVIADRPAWSPDGRWLAYSNYDGDLKRIHPNGTGAEVLGRFPGQELRDFAWSPGGEYLTYTSQELHQGD